MHEGERLNTCTHFVGLLLAVVGATVLLGDALATQSARTVLSLSAFALSMVALYASSTLYHGSRDTAKALWARVDHCAIFLLIAGTYTPIALLAVRGALGWCLLAAIWLLALFGIWLEMKSTADKKPHVALYVAMGWIGLVAASAIVQNLSGSGLFCLLLGAGLYSFGVLFYLKDGVWRHAHGVWHLFVIGGTASHYLAIRSLLA